MRKQDFNPGTEERFWAKVDKNKGHGSHGDCWIWTACKTRGYGVLKLGSKKPNILAHRFSYIIKHGELDDNLVLRHKCDNPSCVNPEHLKPGTQTENVQDMIERNRMSWDATHCPKGHEYTEENTYRRASGARLCLKCASINANKYYHKNREKFLKPPRTHCRRGHEHFPGSRDKTGYCLRCRDLRRKEREAEK